MLGSATSPTAHIKICEIFFATKVSDLAKSTKIKRKKYFNTYTMQLNASEIILQYKMIIEYDILYRKNFPHKYSYSVCTQSTQQQTMQESVSLVVTSPGKGHTLCRDWRSAKHTGEKEGARENLSEKVGWGGGAMKGNPISKVAAE